MEGHIHTMTALFDQLGLDSTEEAIGCFVEKNRPLPAEVALSKAEFWNVSQATFLRNKIDEDADWAEVVDQLNTMLR